jgi:hypothetical protein
MKTKSQNTNYKSQINPNIQNTMTKTGRKQRLPLENWSLDVGAYLRFVICNLVLALPI